jgi:hypothetical protein
VRASVVEPNLIRQRRNLGIAASRQPWPRA